MVESIPNKNELAAGLLKSGIEDLRKTTFNNLHTKKIPTPYNDISESEGVIVSCKWGSKYQEDLS